MSIGAFILQLAATLILTGSLVTLVLLSLFYIHDWWTSR